MKTDEFCEFYFQCPGTVYDKFNEFIAATGLKMSFSEFKECIDTVDKLNTVDSYILTKFINYLEEKKNV